VDAGQVDRRDDDETFLFLLLLFFCVLVPVTAAAVGLAADERRWAGALDWRRCAAARGLPFLSLFFRRPFDQPGCFSPCD